MWDHRLNCWNTIDRLVRMRVTCARSAGRRARPVPCQRIGSPSNRISPDWLSSSRLQQRRRVDLPEPDDPIIEIACPRGADRLTPFKTSSSPKLLCRSFISMTGGSVCGTAFDHIGFEARVGTKSQCIATIDCPMPGRLLPAVGSGGAKTGNGPQPIAFCRAMFESRSDTPRNLAMSRISASSSSARSPSANTTRHAAATTLVRSS